MFARYIGIVIVPVVDALGVFVGAVGGVDSDVVGVGGGDVRCDSGGSKRDLWGSVSDVQSMQPRQSVNYLHLTLALNLHSFGNIFFRIRCWPTLRMSFSFCFFSPPLSLFQVLFSFLLFSFIRLL